VKETILGKTLKGLVILPSDNGLWALNLCFADAAGIVLVEIIDTLESIRGIAAKAITNVGKSVEMALNHGALIIFRFFKGAIMTFALDTASCNSL
jgi:hypothetical protein